MANTNTTTALVPYNPRFKFGWGYVADCAEQRMLNTARAMDRQLDATMKEVRKANKVIEAVKASSR